MHNASVGKLTAFLPQEVALWRLQNNWAFMCCSTTESILSWQPLAPLFSTGQSITTGNIISFTQFQVPASPPPARLLHFTLIQPRCYSLSPVLGAIQSPLPKGPQQETCHTTWELMCWGAQAWCSVQREEEMEMLEQAVWHSFLAGLRVYSWDAAFLQTKEN